MLQVRNILLDILDYTYPNSDKLEKYKKFYIEITQKNMKGRHGDYTRKTHHIRIFNLYRDDTAIIATTIHELAHHVDYINRGDTGHDKNFYNVFKELLYSALDMGIFSIDDFLSAYRDSSSSNKIAKFVKSYQPKKTEYKRDKQKITVKNCFNIKEKLKENGYKYNSINHSWEKEINKADIEKELSLLSNTEATYTITDATLITFDGKRYIIAKEGTFEIKDELREMGFRFERNNKCWKIEYDKETFRLCKERWPNVSFFVK